MYRAGIIIGWNLRRLRQEFGQTQTFVAEAADLSLRAYQSIEAGEANPTVKTLENLAQHFQVSLPSLCNLSSVRVEGLNKFATAVVKRFTGVDYGVMIRDLNGVVTWFNQRVHELSGLDIKHLPIDLFKMANGPAREMMRVNFECQKRGYAAPMINYVTNQSGDNVYMRLRPTLVYVGSSSLPEVACVYVDCACEHREADYQDFSYSLVSLVSKL